MLTVLGWVCCCIGVEPHSCCAASLSGSAGPFPMRLGFCWLLGLGLLGCAAGDDSAAVRPWLAPPGVAPHARHWRAAGVASGVSSPSCPGRSAPWTYRIRSPQAGGPKFPRDGMNPTRLIRRTDPLSGRHRPAAQPRRRVPSPPRYGAHRTSTSPPMCLPSIAGMCFFKTCPLYLN